MFKKYIIVLDGVDGSGKTPVANLFEKIGFKKKELKELFLLSKNVEELIGNIEKELNGGSNFVVWDRLILSLYWLLKSYYKLDDDSILKIFYRLFANYKGKIFLFFIDSSWYKIRERIIKRGDISENDLRIIKDKAFYDEYKSIFRECISKLRRSGFKNIKIIKVKTDFVPTKIAIILNNYLG